MPSSLASQPLETKTNSNIPVDLPFTTESVHEDLFPSDQSNSSGLPNQDSIYVDKSQDLLKEATWQTKLLILVCMLSLPVGCHYLEATMGTLKTTLKNSMHINNTQFSILLSSVSLVNTILPLLAGTFVDDLSSVGSIRGSTLVSTVIFSGSLMVSLAAERNSYPVMITGQIIYGLGGGMIVTMQEAILSRWFRDRQLAIVIGILLSFARLTKWAAKMVCYPIVNSTQSHAWPIHVATILCGVGIVMNFLYWAVMYRHGCSTVYGKEISQPITGYQSQFAASQSPNNGRSSFRWSSRMFLLLPSTFWMVPWVQLVMSSVLSSFDDVATEFIQFRYNTTSVMAGYQSSLTQVMPIVVAPIMGIIVHRYGKRLTSLFFATLILILSMVLLAYTWVTPAVGMILFSLALALGPVSVLSSTSLLLPHELAGTGMGLHKCANNIGSTIVSVLIGYVQDLTFHDGDPHDDQQDLESEYDGVMIFFLIMGCFSTLIAILFWVMDSRLLSGWLQADIKERERRIEQVKLEQTESKYENKNLFDTKSLQKIGSQMRTKPTYVYVSFYGFWLVVSWVIFFAFALMPVYQKYNI
ncbi:major facilitator superfamily domain-containing protein [Phycomyces blakesleeanus]|uniref:Lysosomal dipeptide transporter MFSD1 n=1 Tax=Phycomyces blakesleeanus TaxID=4837 RepID=A0ABR3BBA8_PHYBL